VKSPSPWGWEIESDAKKRKMYDFCKKTHVKTTSFAIIIATRTVIPPAAKKHQALYRAGKSITPYRRGNGKWKSSLCE
jgi:hypothetical protein